MEIGSTASAVSYPLGMWSSWSGYEVDPDWNPAGKPKNTVMWDNVVRLMVKHPNMSTDQVTKLADCGVATVYRIKREQKA